MEKLAEARGMLYKATTFNNKLEISITEERNFERIITGVNKYYIGDVLDVENKIQSVYRIDIGINTYLFITSFRRPIIEDSFFSEPEKYGP